MIEELSNLEHEQWMQWSKAVSKVLAEASDKLSNTTGADIEDDERLEEAEMLLNEKNLAWANNWKPYNGLDEATKEFDRIWARKVLVVIKKELEENLKKELLNEFLNGNLKHSFNQKLVSDKKYVDTFIGNLDLLNEVDV